jgi:hypothetical protein
MDLHLVPSPASPLIVRFGRRDRRKMPPVRPRQGSSGKYLIYMVVSMMTGSKSRHRIDDSPCFGRFTGVGGKWPEGPPASSPATIDEAPPARLIAAGDSRAEHHHGGRDEPYYALRATVVLTISGVGRCRATSVTDLAAPAILTNVCSSLATPARRVFSSSQLRR